MQMVILYKDPKGEKIFDRGQSQGTLNLTAADEARIEQFGDLEKHCLDLESRLAKYEVSLFNQFNRHPHSPLSFFFFSLLHLLEV